MMSSIYIRYVEDEASLSEAQHSGSLWTLFDVEHKEPKMYYKVCVIGFFIRFFDFCKILFSDILLFVRIFNVQRIIYILC